MERTKLTRPTKGLTEDEKLLATAEHIGRKIPGCEHLKYEYSDFWSPFGLGQITAQDIKTIKKDIRHSVWRWIKDTDEETINRTIQQLNPAARVLLHEIVPVKYCGFFETRKGQYPSELALPIPFIPVQKQYRNEHTLIRYPIDRHFGDVTMRIMGQIAIPDDAPKYIALNQIRKRSHVDLLDENLLSFKTSCLEIAREMGKKNPSQHSDEILISLERLRSMTMRWSKGKEFYSGGLLHILTNLNDVNTLKIYQDRFFLNKMFNQFIGIDEKILPTFYHLKGKQINLWLFLNRFQSFNQFGNWNSQTWNMDIKKIYELASLRNPFAGEISISDMRYELHELLKSLKQAGFIHERILFSGNKNYVEIGIRKMKKETRENPLGGKS